MPHVENPKPPFTPGTLIRSGDHNFNFDLIYNKPILLPFQVELAGVGSLAYQRSLSVATAGQTVFGIPFTYTTDSKTLWVFADGRLLTPGLTNDYVESAATQITFNSPVPLGTFVSFLSLATTGTITRDRDNFVATAAQTLFNLGFTYIADGKSLKVYSDGLEMTQGVDYNETSVTSITFITGRPTGATVAAVAISTLPGQINNQDDFVATPAQTIFNLGFTYPTTGKALEVYSGGILMRPGAGNDYTESAGNQITFITGRPTGENVSALLVESVAAGPTTITLSGGVVQDINDLTPVNEFFDLTQRVSVGDTVDMENLQTEAALIDTSNEDLIRGEVTAVSATQIDIKFVSSENPTGPLTLPPQDLLLILPVHTVFHRLPEDFLRKEFISSLESDDDVRDDIVAIFAALLTKFTQNGDSFGATAVVGTNDAFNLEFETGGTSWAAIDTAGFFGVGTTAPTTDFDLRKTKPGDDVQMDITNLSDTADSFAALSIRVGGPNAGNADVVFHVIGQQLWAAGIHNQAAVDDSFVIAAGDVFGTGDDVLILEPSKRARFAGPVWDGRLTTAEENTLVGTLIAADGGAHWFNTDDSQFKGWNGDLGNSGQDGIVVLA